MGDDDRTERERQRDRRLLIAKTCDPDEMSDEEREQWRSEIDRQEDVDARRKGS